MKSLRRTVTLGLAALLTSGVAWAQQPGQPGQRDQGQRGQQPAQQGMGGHEELGGLKVGNTVNIPETLKVKNTDGEQVALKEKFEKDQVSAIQFIELQTLMAQAGKAKDEWFKEKKQSALPAELREFHGAYQRLKDKDVTWLIIAECAPGEARLEGTEKANKIDTFLDEHGLDDVTVLIDDGRQVCALFKGTQAGQGGLGQQQPGQRDQFGQGRDMQGQGQQGMRGQQGQGKAIALVTKSANDGTANVVFAEKIQPGMEHRNYLAQALEQVIAGQAVTNPYGATSVPAGTPREGGRQPGQLPGQDKDQDLDQDKDMDQPRTPGGANPPR